MYLCSRSLYKGKIHKEDKEGSPIYIEKLGPVDVKGLATSVPKDKLIHYQIYVQEKDTQQYVIIYLLFIVDFLLVFVLNLTNNNISAEELSKKAGKPIERVIIIEDLAGVGWSHIYTPAVSLYQEVASIPFPHMLRCIHISLHRSSKWPMQTIQKR
jgi:hypothetical protein